MKQVPPVILGGTRGRQNLRWMILAVLVCVAVD